MDGEEALIHLWWPLVYKMAHRLKPLYHRVFDFDDAVQEGLLGLLCAVRRFDPQKGDFDKFASPHIFGAIRDALRKLRFDRSYARVRDRKKAGKRNYPKVTCFCDAEVDPKIEDNAPVWVVDQRTPALAAEEKERARIVRIAIHDLPERERASIEWMDIDNRFLMELAEIVGVSRSRMSQVRIRGLKRLAEILKLRGVKS